MSDFLRVSELLEAFPNPAGTTVKSIRERFGVCPRVAGQARALAIDLVTVRQLQRKLGVSQDEAESLFATRRPPHTDYGHQAGCEVRVARKGPSRG